MFDINLDEYISVVSSNSFSLNAGYQIVDISFSTGPLTTVGPQETNTYFAAVKLSSAASTSTPNTFRAIIDGEVDISLRDSPSKVYQDITDIAPKNSGVLTATEKLKTDWVNVSKGSVPVYSAVYSYYGNTDVFGAADDGILKSFDASGNLDWKYDVGAKIRTDINGAEESGNIYVYFGDDSGIVYKLRDDGNSSTLMWSKNLGAAASFVAVRDYLYIPCADGRVYKLCGLHPTKAMFSGLI
jgi:hypothetical protein